MPATPRRSAATGKAKAMPIALPQQENTNTQDAEEAAQADSLLAELMRGTPRQRTPSARSIPEANVRKKPRAAGDGDDDESDENDAAEPPSEEDDDAIDTTAAAKAAADEEDGWYADCVMARRRLKPEVEGGPPSEWQYLIRWVGKGPEEDRWVPESALNREFLQQDLQEAMTERAMERASLSARQVPESGAA